MPTLPAPSPTLIPSTLPSPGRPFPYSLPNFAYKQERMHGLAITGNNMLYYEKQFTILQIMAQKRTCRVHVPFDRGNKVTTHPKKTKQRCRASQIGRAYEKDIQYIY